MSDWARVHFSRELREESKRKGEPAFVLAVSGGIGHRVTISGTADPDLEARIVRFIRDASMEAEDRPPLLKEPSR